MAKSFLISVILHLFVLGFLTFSEVQETEDFAYAETVRIRIGQRSINGRLSGKARTSFPSKSSRSTRKKAKIPRYQGDGDVFSFTSGVEYIKSIQKNASIVEWKSNRSPLPRVANTIGTKTLAGIDPLAGVDMLVSGTEFPPGKDLRPWSLTLENGEQRAILSEPVIRQDEILEGTERLQNIDLKIRISPQGEVISAEISAPGSGDIRIDRRIHNVALQFVLEPWPEEKGIQEGSLHLMFLEKH